MIFRLEIENFHSIRFSQEIDLVVGKLPSDSHDRLFPIGPGAKELAPVIVSIFGANGSGKSTILKALSFLSWFVKDSFRNSPERYLPFTTFKATSSIAKPTRLLVGFTGPEDPSMFGFSVEKCCKYSYEVVFSSKSHSPQTVLSETLKLWTKETNRPINLFHRNENGIVKAHKYFALAGYNSALEKVLRPNVSVISTLAHLQHPISTVLWQSSTQFYSNIFIQKSDPDEDVVLRDYKEDSDLLAALNKEMQRFDIGIDRMDVVDGPYGAKAQIHHFGLDGPLSMLLESHGTKQFIKVFPLIYRALQVGGIAAIDELDLSIHPLVLPEILSWFHDKKRNILGAQLWVTGQNPSLLEDLTKEEIFFCEKNDNGETSIYGLRDIKAVRREDNYYRKYLSGIYGAIPRLG